MKTYILKIIKKKLKNLILLEIESGSIEFNLFSTF